MKAVILLVCLLTYNTFASPSVMAASGTDMPGSQGEEMAVGAPPELMHWGKLMGRWSTTEEGLNPDTSEWEPSNGGDWDFHWAFDGWGIRDTYTSPPRDVVLDDESTRQRGINLRIYNPTLDKWVLTWLTTASERALTMTAVSSDDEIVMLGDEVNPQGRYSRITFFDMTENRFEWKLEWSTDQDRWFEVYRIHATRKLEDGLEQERQVEVTPENMVSEDADMVSELTDMVPEDTDVVSEDTDTVSEDTGMDSEETDMVSEDTE